MILGHTGSGKSVAGIHHLSQRSWTRMPWIVFDPKHDDLLAVLKSDRVMREVGLHEKLPRKPGLYIIHPVAGEDDDAYDKYLAKIINGTKTGLYFDEGFTIPQRMPRFNALGRIQMQGRSKSIPTIILSQRPNWMNAFVWSEADYFQYFGLNAELDRKKTAGFVGFDPNIHPPKYHSWWWDVAQQKSFALKPLPDPDTIRENFYNRIGAPVHRFL